MAYQTPPIIKHINALRISQDEFPALSSAKPRVPQSSNVWTGTPPITARQENLPFRIITKASKPKTPRRCAVEADRSTLTLPMVSNIILDKPTDSHMSASSPSCSTPPSATPTKGPCSLNDPKPIPDLPKPILHTANRPPLLRIPLELHLDIIDILSATDIVTLMKLRLINRYFHSLIPRPTHATLLSWELKPHIIAQNLFACRYCVFLHPASRFAASMLRGKTSLGGSARNKRFCADCGLTKSIYSPGTELIVGGEKVVWCVVCGKVFKGEKAEGCSVCCKACHGVRWCGCQGRRVSRTGGYERVRKDYFAGR